MCSAAQCRTPNTVHYTLLCRRQSVESSGSGSGSALEKQQHIHIARNRSTYAEVRTYSIYYSLAHVVVCVLFSCYAIAMPCIASSLSFHAMPCHAMPCHVHPATPCPQPGLAHPPQSSIDISAVSYPAFPTIGSQTRLHFGFRTSPTKRPVPSLALSCAAKVGAQPASLPISACLPASRPRLLV